jgi:hypothetical protein|tara:strand:- start:4356 stop:4631 length:276 start_codon:yes stop_codon:yes gene_type:complete
MGSNMTKREDILKEAEQLVNGDRAKDYGDAYVNHKRIADMWSVIFEKEVTVRQVILCMIAVKMSRLMHETKKDSWVDICGYSAIAGEIHEK